MTQNSEHYQVKRLFLPASQKMIYAYPHEDNRSWLDYLERVIYRHHLTEPMVEIIASNDNVSYRQIHKIKEDTRLVMETVQVVEPDQKGTGVSKLTDVIMEYPLLLFAKAEENGTLSVIACFTEDEENINRVETATFSTFEVDWLTSDFQA